MVSIFNELKERKMITKEHIEAELNKLHTANGMMPSPLLNSDLGLAIINDLLKQVKNIAYEPVLTSVIYKQSFIDRFNKYFEYKPKTYEYVSKNSKREYTLDDLHKEYEKAMGETPFNRG